MEKNNNYNFETVWLWVGEDVDIHALEKHNEIMRAKCERHWASIESYKILCF